MKKFFCLVAFSMIASSAFAASDCHSLATQAAQQIYALRDNPKAVKNADVQVNPNNTSNGVELVVTLIDNQDLVLDQYLVSMTPDGPGPGANCKRVDYTIVYPYANLMKQ